MRKQEGPSIHTLRAKALAQMELPYILTTGEPFMYVPHLDVVFGTEAANDPN